MTDVRDFAAEVFDHAAGFGKARARRVVGSKALGFEVGAAIASAVAQLIRSLGADDAKKAINDLVARKNDGTIDDDDLRADDASIREAVADMFADDPVSSDTD